MEYNYLLNMPLWSLTYEKVERLKKDEKEKKSELNSLIDTKVQDMWKSELETFLAVLDKIETEEEEERVAASKGTTR